MRTILVVAAFCVLPIPASHAEEKKPTRKVDFDMVETKTMVGTLLTATKDAVTLSLSGGPVTIYPVHDCLAAGKYHAKVYSARSYRLQDVEPGDLLFFGTIVENKITYCVDFTIRERPGGLVPPPQIIDKKQPYHDRRNAEIAFRDKGTPIPEHLKPVLPTAPPLDKKK